MAECLATFAILTPLALLLPALAHKQSFSLSQIYKQNFIAYRTLFLSTLSGGLIMPFITILLCMWFAGWVSTLLTGVSLSEPGYGPSTLYETLGFFLILPIGLYLYQMILLTIIVVYYKKIILKK